MNNYIIVRQDELNHYGVRGMKWGVRKDPGYSSARTQYKQARRAYSKAYNRAYGFSSAHPVTQWVKKSKNYNKSNELWRDAHAKAKAVQDAKSKMKMAKKIVKDNIIKDRKNKVSSYSKAYDKASSLSDKADAKSRQASQTYKELGKTPLGRINQVIKAQKGGGSTKAKQYLKQYDSWEKSQNKADAAWSETRKKRSEIGKNWITQTVRTAKYSRG